MTDTITLKREVVQVWLRDLHRLNDLDPHPKTAYICKEIEAALATPEPENVAKAFRETFLRALAEQPEPEAGEHPLQAYAYSYRRIAKMGDGRVFAGDVAVDIERNMIPVTAPVQPVQEPLGTQISRAIKAEDERDALKQDLAKLRAELATQVALVEKCMVAMNENADKGEKAEAELAMLKAQPVQEPVALLPFDCWSTDDGDSWFEHPADAQIIYDLLGNAPKVGDEFELTAGWRSTTARYRITEITGDGEDFEVECVSHPNAAPVQPVQPAEPGCSDHPDAPHGFNRNASHNAHRYVCDCEGWTP